MKATVQHGVASSPLPQKNILRRSRVLLKTFGEKRHLQGFRVVGIRGNNSMRNRRKESNPPEQRRRMSSTMLRHMLWVGSNSCLDDSALVVLGPDPVVPPSEGEAQARITLLPAGSWPGSTCGPVTLARSNFDFRAGCRWKASPVVDDVGGRRQPQCRCLANT